jgi:predicted transcriptional regulator
MKAHVQKIADERHLTLSDITREAFREFLSRQPRLATKPQEEKAAA